jgi:type IV secretion system protein VirB8
MSRDAALDAYFAEAASWDADRAAQARRTLRVAWSVAGAGWFCALLVAAALMLLMPLKRVDPFVIRVDNSTGIVDVVPVFVGQMMMPDAVTRYFLDHYITVCERFAHASAESDYEECGAFHTAQRNQAWYAHWNRSNPESPLNVYKDGTTIRAQVTAVSFFARASGVGDLAQVRYIKSKRAGGTAEEQNTYWIATVQYAYGQPSKDPKTRRWNPLGFRIVDFRSEPEVLSEPRPTAIPSVASSASTALPEATQ